jgi:putative ubiquitin-RnfH superfamily antitoxin RatB of RatAB toxin-antitoxin module
MAADSLPLPPSPHEEGAKLPVMSAPMLPSVAADVPPKVLPNAPPGMLIVQVCFADVGGVWERDVQLADGSTVQAALDASGFRQAYPNVDPALLGVGIYGKVVPFTTLLQPHDRIDIYRALRFDPKDSRRRRADHRARRLRQARGG